MSARPSAAQTGEDISILPHPRWNPSKPGERHPKDAAQWNWREDRAPHGLSRSYARLAVATDYDDPRAPDQMAQVLRIDLMRIMGDYVRLLAWQDALRAERVEAASSTPQDPVQAWLQACCVTAPVCAPNARELFPTLYESYCAWCAENGLRPLLVSPFGTALKDYGILFAGKNNRGQRWRAPVQIKASQA